MLLTTTTSAMSTPNPIIQDVYNVLEEQKKTLKHGMTILRLTYMMHTLS